MTLFNENARGHLNANVLLIERSDAWIIKITKKKIFFLHQNFVNIFDIFILF